jgi:hypothetical protein
MEPLTLTLQLDLDREVQGRWRSGLAGYESDGTPIEGAFPVDRTFADVVAELAAHALVADLKRDSEHYGGLKRQVAELRVEMIRAALEPTITAALEGSVQPTDRWGEPTGEPTTLRAMVMAEVNRALTKPEHRSGVNRDGETLVQRVIREQVTSVLAKELAEAAAIAKAEVKGAVATSAAQAIAEAVVKGVTAR